MADEKSFDYPGESATVTWHGKFCIHIGECGRAKGELFVAGRKPWCQPDLASDDEVREVVLRCPTGALTYRHADGANSETAGVTNEVQVAYNGPLFVSGDLDIENAPAEVSGLRFRAALCRCGKSKNKPYCDNSHETEGFQDYGAVGDTGPGTSEPGGPLQVRLAKDGPLLLKGNVTITGSSARSSWQGRQVALCRCGASGNKPFCDGQHKKVGFKSE